MKNFIDYLTESKKTYNFRLKIAGVELDDPTLTKIENALACYELSSISKARRLPIQDCSREFPNLGPCEVNLIDIVLEYPATDEQIRTCLNNNAELPAANVKVVPRDHPEEQAREAEREAADKTPEAILTQDYPKEKQAEVYGDDYNKKMLKRVPTRKYDFAAKNGGEGKTTSDLPTGQKSPLGGHKPKLPTPKR